jgi:hypothetical protein
MIKAPSDRLPAVKVLQTNDLERQQCEEREIRRLRFRKTLTLAPVRRGSFQFSRGPHRIAELSRRAREFNETTERSLYFRLQKCPT